MKIIGLNTWGGRISQPLLEFFENYKDIDIFCLQEIYHEATLDMVEEEYKEDSLNLFGDIQSILEEHVGYFRPCVNGCYGLAVFVKDTITVQREGEVTIYDAPDYKGGGNHSRNLQYIEFEKDKEKYVVVNVHGLWNGEGKSDSPSRLSQSENIRNLVDSLEGSKIICGDMNLLPETESMKILEKGMRNLISEYKVSSTRSSLYKKPLKFADYILVSPDLEVKDFKVLPDEVSDHLPLFLEL
ncbi:MAG: endonuclease/exonuclease/phosphatase family protein [Parcubacteria group bacterium]